MIVDGLDVVDTPITLRSGQTLQNVSVVFTNKLTEINGTVTDTRGNPLTEFTVLAFPTESLLWRPLARQIATARPDQNGKFQLRGLPPGNYYLATVDPAEQGEWFEPAFLEAAPDWGGADLARRRRGADARFPDLNEMRSPAFGTP